MHNQTVLSHDDTKTILDTIYEKANAENDALAVAVVDAHGELLGFLRMDGCRLSSIQIAMNKAYTAAREQVESKELGRIAGIANFPMTNFGELKYVTWGGGIPIKVNGEVIGAVGVSGLPESDDISYAQLGVQALSLAD